MNQTLKKFAAATTIVMMGLCAAPAMAEDTALIAAQEDAAAKDGAQAFVPVRDAMALFGVDIRWEQVNTCKLVFTANGQSLEAAVDQANHTVSTDAGTFTYENKDGRISLPLSFYETILSNVWVQYNAKTGSLQESLYDASQPVGVRNMPVYQQEVATPVETATYYESGIATWYGPALNGNYTASGEIFNMYDYTAAHKYLPFGTRVRVTNQNNGRSVVVRITDRGPFAPGRVIDLSLQAAQDIDIVSSGVAPVTLEILN